jgi:hypothetical protein
MFGRRFPSASNAAVNIALTTAASAAAAVGCVAFSGPGYLPTFSSNIASNGQFEYPRSMALDYEGTVVVANENHDVDDDHVIVLITINMMNSCLLLLLRWF